jgi:hypothetical protein
MFKKRRILVYLWLVALLALLANIGFPVRTGLTRLSLVVLALIVLTGLVLISWRNRILRFSILGVCLAIPVFLSIPSQHPIDPNTLRELYVQKLKRYNGTRYVYGGENGFGIDCSGLVREGMIEALLTYGTRHLHSGAIRSAIKLWWHDCNATRLVNLPGITQPIRGDEYGPLHEIAGVEAGDLAITKSGSHVLAYLGHQQWIEADPGVGGTHLFTLDGEFKNLSDELVLFVRWRWLEPPTQRNG